MTKKQVVDPIFPECPIRNIIARIGDKWSILVLLTLDETKHPMRFKALEAAIPDISQKMLTQVLRDLEADGLVLRHAYAEVPPRLEYELTDRSRSLLPHIHNLVGWVLDNLSDIVKDRKAFMEKG